MDVSFQYYLPAFFGIASGEAATVSRFENYESNSRYLIPVENKISILYYEAFSMSLNSIFSIYIEDKLFSSINYSAGISAFLHGCQTLAMTGWFISLYPIYELPVIYDRRKKSLCDWRTAADIGYSIVLFKVLQINAYTRFFFVWLDSEFGVLPDAGISLGIRL